MGIIFKWSKFVAVWRMSRKEEQGHPQVRGTLHGQGLQERGWWVGGGKKKPNTLPMVIDWFSKKCLGKGWLRSIDHGQKINRFTNLPPKRHFSLVTQLFGINCFFCVFWHVQKKPAAWAIWSCGQAWWSVPCQLDTRCFHDEGRPPHRVALHPFLWRATLPSGLSRVFQQDLQELNRRHDFAWHAGGWWISLLVMLWTDVPSILIRPALWIAIVCGCVHWLIFAMVYVFFWTLLEAEGDVFRIFAQFIPKFAPKMQFFLALFLKFSIFLKLAFSP